MMKKILFIFSVFAFLFFTNSASAHFLATDRNIGAVLHMEPNDDPVAGQQASFFFEFKDKDNKFDPKNCDCTFVISENGNTLYSQPLFQNETNPSLSNAAVFYTFSQKGAFDVKVSGKPTKENGFQSFNLNWSLRIDKIAGGNDTINNNSQSFLSTHVVHLVIIVIGIIVFFYLIKNNSKKSSKKEGDKKN